MPIPVTVLVQTKNEAVGIRACLEQLSDFSEVIVVDSNSTDGTPEIVASMGHRLVNFSWNGQYPKKKQWQLNNIKPANPWILFLDADEAPTATFLRALPELIRDADIREIRAFDLGLIYTFDGRELHHGHKVSKRALIRIGSVQFPEIDDLRAPGMGELEGHYQPLVSGNHEFIQRSIVHDDKDPVATWFTRHNRYSDWETYLRTTPAARKSVARARSRQGQAFDAVPGKPLLFFGYAYIWRRGFLDGLPGLNYAIALSFYYWQVSLKVREQKRRTK